MEQNPPRAGELTQEDLERELRSLREETSVVEEALKEVKKQDK